MSDWSAPQIIVAAMMGLTLFGGLVLHGKPRRDPNYDFGTIAINTLFWGVLLAWGGFWS